MNSYHIKKGIYKYVAFFVLMIGFLSCTSMNDPYQKFIEGGERVYPGKSDSILIYPGKNRVKLQWYESDPSVKKAIVSWRNHTDSIVVSSDNFKPTTNPNLEKVSITLNDLTEGVYTFRIENFDAKGNKSLETQATGHVYGDEYINTLLPRVENRAIYSFQDSTLEIKWAAPGDESAVSLILTYTDALGTARRDTVPRSENSTTLSNFDLVKGFKYKTGFVPDSMALDTFYTTTKGHADEIRLVNPGPSFEHGDHFDGRYGSLKGWTVNDAAQTHGGGTYGGYDVLGGGSLALQKYYPSQPDVINGKIYQTVTLPAGSYSFEADTPHLTDPARGYIYLIASDGQSLPDVSNLDSEAMDYVTLDNFSTVDFTLNSKTEVSMGFAATWTDDHQEIRTNKVRLYKNN